MGKKTLPRVVMMYLLLGFLFVSAALLIVYRIYLPPREGFDQEDRRQWNSHTDLVIVTAHFKEDLEWLRQSGLPLVICSKEQATPQPDAEPRCMIPNKGREASSLLKFIIAFYDKLPKRIAFVHGHELAWHQRFDILSAIQCAKKDKPFVSLNVIFMDDRNLSNPTYLSIKDLWKDHFKPWLNIEFPERVFHDCCAQFIVSRDAVRRIPKRGYEHWLQLLMNSPHDNILSVQFEYLWHIIFGEDPILQLDPESYVKEHFDCMPRFLDRDVAEAAGSDYTTKFSIVG